MTFDFRETITKHSVHSCAGLLTYLTMCTRIARCAVTLVAIHEVNTGGHVLTGTAPTLICV